MKEAIGHLLNPSTLEPNLGLYSGTLGIDNSREYKTSFLSSWKKIDSVLVDLITEDFLLNLRIFRGPGACKALLNLWFFKDENFKDFEWAGSPGKEFLSRGTFRNGYWSFTQGNQRFNFRLDDTIQQGYTHSSILASNLNLQLDALVSTVEKTHKPVSSLEESGKDWLFRLISPDLSVRGQLAIDDNTWNLESSEKLSYSIAAGFGNQSFFPESRIYGWSSGKNSFRLNIHPNTGILLWKNGIPTFLETATFKKESLSYVLHDPSDQIELTVTPVRSTHHTISGFFGKKIPMERVEGKISGKIRVGNKKETIKKGFAILEI
ncbi:hypothetical protein [Leptospira kmetyi]|uniref:DUF2804 domain-containing protein n=1 Tax=Leptospira kmetyi TaxID=408139 RepID=A0A5F1XS43_9LEPT|nr:hypothetical protein [Leptospira kmetyi]AYV55333.1 hypothetical protein EFP84_07290 [Leptospira kmetyi]PJZ30949.1 hypothetical protein CH378_04740 [Leptospira kmetyi]TGK16867.1 hypothetical protein EHO62_14270 [Leptospira kmetyi]TGK33042.1 hypothetical protein EHO66_04735 [Leptospira kmetyi]TGL70537.1 hypothetical protein EHQ67_07070 [Leptospira kmetyi]